MTLEELDRQLESNEELLAASLENYKNAKASLRKARITSVSNKLLAPFKRFQINLAVAKYDAMIERIEKKREKERVKLEKMQQREARKEAKEDFKAAIREKLKEDINNFIDDKKEKIENITLDVKNMGKGVVSKTSSFVSNVNNSLITKMKENTTIDLTIKNAIEDMKLKYATNKYNKAVEQKKEEKINNAINFDEGVKIELKQKDVPFANIEEKIQKASKKNSYMGKATNRVVRYFKDKRDKAKEMILDTEINIIGNAFEVMGKVSMTKSRISTVFNNKISDLMVNVDDKVKDIKTSAIEFKDNINDSIANRRKLKERKKDMIAALREQDEKDIAIKKAQLDSMREAINAVNNTGDIFGDSPSFDVRRTK